MEFGLKHFLVALFIESPIALAPTVYPSDEAPQAKAKAFLDSSVYRAKQAGLLDYCVKLV